MGRQILTKIVVFSLLVMSQVGYIALSMVYLALFFYAWVQYTLFHHVSNATIAFGDLGVCGSALALALATNLVIVGLLQRLKNKLEDKLER